MGVRLIGLLLGLGAFWNLITTFRGVAQIFDLAMDFDLNPPEFGFAIVVTVIVFGFVVASAVIWSYTTVNIITTMLRASWFICLVVNFYASWLGTSQLVFYGDTRDMIRSTGLAVFTFVIISSSILFSKLMLTQDIKGKPFLF